MHSARLVRVPFAIGIPSQALQQVFWLSDRLKLCSLPPEVDLESGRNLTPCRPPSPITAAGPPRTFTVFRVAGKRRILFVRAHIYQNELSSVKDYSAWYSSTELTAPYPCRHSDGSRNPDNSLDASACPGPRSGIHRRDGVTIGHSFR